jgi:hypothetical protein
MVMEKPMMVAMVICDQIITEEGTRKKSIIGCFNNINSPSFPCVHPTFFVFVALTNGKGNFKVKLKCINESDDSTIFEVGASLNISDPMQTVEMGFKLVNLTFPNPGNHAIQFWCDEELLMPKRFNVKLIDQK